MSMSLSLSYFIDNGFSESQPCYVVKDLALRRSIVACELCGKPLFYLNTDSEIVIEGRDVFDTAYLRIREHFEGSIPCDHVHKYLSEYDADSIPELFDVKSMPTNKTIEKRVLRVIRFK